MGLCYVFSKQCQAGMHVKQMLPYKTEVGLQVCYLPIPSLVLFGVVGSSSDCGFGFQYALDRIICRFQTQYRPIVGYSTHIGASYLFKKSIQNKQS
jgi:hypothetical protein